MENIYNEINYEYPIGKVNYSVNLFFKNDAKTTFRNKLEKAAKIDIQCGFEESDDESIIAFSQ